MSVDWVRRPSVADRWRSSVNLITGRKQGMGTRANPSMAGRNYLSVARPLGIQTKSSSIGMGPLIPSIDGTTSVCRGESPRMVYRESTLKRWISNLGPNPSLALFGSVWGWSKATRSFGFQVQDRTYWNCGDSSLNCFWNCLSV